MARSNLNLPNRRFIHKYIVFLVCSMATEVLTFDNQSDIISAIIKCVNFAAVKHKDQRRKDKAETPYINHPIGMLHNKPYFVI